MTNATLAQISGDAAPAEVYVLEIDGEDRSQYRLFVEALRVALAFKHDFPERSVKVRGSLDRPCDNGRSENQLAPAA
jgi:hypothetical protein